jgi:hypothetical protein
MRHSIRLGFDSQFKMWFVIADAVKLSIIVGDQDDQFSTLPNPHI